MKIGFDISVLNDVQKTGIAVYTYNLIENILKEDKDDQFTLFGISTIQTNNYLTNLPLKNSQNTNVKVYRLPSKLFRTLFKIWQKLDWPPIEKFTEKVDLFHSFNWYLPPQRSGKIVSTVFDLTSVLFPQWHDRKTTELDKIRFQRISQKADLVITISENSKKDFLKIWPKTNIEVIYPAVSSLFTSSKIGGEKGVLIKYKLKPGYFLSVSTLEPRKNLELLVKAFLETQTNKRLILVGGLGWKNQPLLKLVNENKDRISLTGFVPEKDLVVLYRNALCLVYPSLYEGFGIPVLEAMACGTPVISSNAASLPEVGGEAALYIDPESLESIIKGLKIIESDEIRKKLVLKGFKQIQKFSWAKSTQKLINLYHKLGQQ